MNRPRRKGTAAETALVTWFVDHGFPFAERRALHGTADKGDVAGIPGVVIEVKNCESLALAAWLEEARQEATNAGASVFAVVHKRRGKGDPGQWYTTMPLAVFAELIR